MTIRTILTTFVVALIAMGFIVFMWKQNTPDFDLSTLPTNVFPVENTTPISTSTIATSSEPVDQ